MTTRWDVVVVGAGASGSALAARLSEDPQRSVLVLEAGPVPTTLDGFGRPLLDAARVPGADPRTRALWRYPATLTSGHDYTVLRGRILGGSTTVNGGYFIRPRREDFERWAAVGGPAWVYENTLPLMRRMESDLDFGDSAIHGADGPVPVSRGRVDDTWSEAFHAAARERGHVDDPDKNAQGSPGIGPVPMNVAEGVRVNTGAAYLLPHLRRENLEVRGGATVSRVRIERGRAIGVEVAFDKRAELIEAGEIVLCAGAFGSAQLLLLSGVGPADELRDAGVAALVDSPVGAGFSDHPQVVVESLPSRPLTPASRWISHALHLATPSAPTSGGVEILQSSTPLAVLTGATLDPTGQPLPFFVALHDAQSRGTLRLDPSLPEGAPVVDFGYLEAEADQAALRAAVRETLALLTTEPFGELGVSAVHAPIDSADDDEVDAWIAARLGTSVHACATAPMGRAGDGVSVVDGAGRVHGVEALRVADTSILPAAPLRGPAAAAVLVGEVVADLMR